MGRIQRIQEFKEFKPFLVLKKNKLRENIKAFDVLARNLEAEVCRAVAINTSEQLKRWR